MSVSTLIMLCLSGLSSIVSIVVYLVSRKNHTQQTAWKIRWDERDHAQKEMTHGQDTVRYHRAGSDVLRDAVLDRAALWLDAAADHHGGDVDTDPDCRAG